LLALALGAGLGFCAGVPEQSLQTSTAEKQNLKDVASNWPINRRSLEKRPPALETTQKSLGQSVTWASN